MTQLNSPRRFYIDHNENQDEPVVRTVSVRRSSHPATHQAKPRLATATMHRPNRRAPRIGKLVQSAVRRRVT